MAFRWVVLGLLLAWGASDSAARDVRGPRRWGRGVNLLLLIDPAKDTVAGAWEWKGRALQAPALQFGRLQVPYVPPEEYDLQAVVERTTGSDSIQLGLAYGWNQFLMIVDGIESDPSTGLDLVDRKPFYDNETTMKGRLIENHVPVTITVSVRRDRIQTWVEGRRVLDWKANYTRLSLWPSWTMPRRDTLFLGSWTGRRLFHSLTLYPITGEGRPIR
jgi:hypothetical protein